MARKSVTVKVADLDAALRQTLTLYHEEVNKAIDAASDKAVKALVKRTRATAPVGKRSSFKRHIASKQLTRTRSGSTYVWYVKAPDYRLTHLLVHGHATRDGGRTKADPFLRDALDAVLPDYQREIEEALKGGNK